MKEKLELKDVAPYLAWGVRLCGCQTKLNPYILKKWEDGEWDVEMLLHPLSDLTKPCLEGGKVPIVELAKMAWHNHEPLIKKYEIIDHGIKYVFDQELFEFEFNKYNSGFSFIRTTPHQTFYPINNQLQLFEKLYEWHFDVKNLIEDGLAIDINTLTK